MNHIRLKQIEAELNNIANCQCQSCIKKLDWLILEMKKYLNMRQVIKKTRLNS